MYSSKNNIWKILVLLVCVGGLFYILNIYTPLYADDFSYSYSFADGERIQNISEIFKSQYAHYFSMNGRFVTHMLAQLYLLMGKTFFNVINTAVFLILGLVIYYHAVGNLKNVKISLLILIYCSLFLFMPSFGQSFLWLDGAATYSHGVTLALIYLIPFRYCFGKRYSRMRFQDYALAVLILMLGIAAGNVVENVSVGIMVVTIIYSIVMYSKRKWRGWMLGIGNIIGLVMLLGSPGIHIRLENSRGNSLGELLKRSVFITFDLVEYGAIFIILLTIAATWGINEKSISIKYIKMYLKEHTGWIYIIGALASIYGMIVSPEFPERAWSGPIIFFIIAVLSVLNDYEKEGNQKTTVEINRKIITNVVVIISLGIYANAFFSIKNIYVENVYREQRIQACLENGQSEAELPSIRSDSSYSCFPSVGDLSYDSDKWPNTAIARYYGLEKIIREDD